MPRLGHGGLTGARAAAARKAREPAMRTIILAILLLLPAALARAAPSEADIRDEIRQRGSALFRTEKFEELDRLALDYRINERRTLSGLWKLGSLQGAILSCQCDDESDFVAMEERAKRWTALNPDSTTAHIVYAQTLIAHAWGYRGTTFASKVPDEAWEPFRDYVEKARAYLIERKEQLAEDPQWYKAMLDIATAQSWPKRAFHDLLKEGLARHPYYYGIYFSAIRYLSPKWHGNERELRELAEYAVGMTGENEGAGLYARIYWYAAAIEFGLDLIIDNPDVWKPMPAAMEDVLAHYPAQWNIIHFARLACVARDRDTAGRMIARIDEKLVPRAWGGGDLTYKQCRDWAMGI